MENNQRRGSGMIAFLIGAVAGGVAALLLAPQSGAQTRSRLKRGARDLRDKGAHLAHRGERGAEGVADAIMGAASEAKHGFRDEQRETAGNKSRTGSQS